MSYFSFLEFLTSSLSSAVRQLLLYAQYGKCLFLPQRQKEERNASVDATFTATIAVLKVRNLH